MFLNKHKKYQYLYLKNKIDLKWYSLQEFNEDGFNTDKQEQRLHHIDDWLDRINLKYKYVKQNELWQKVLKGENVVN